MTYLGKDLLCLVVFWVSVFCLTTWSFQNSQAQTKPLTYPELTTALGSRLPNSVFKTKTQLIDWLITQIKVRKVDKALTPDREDILRQGGATDELIQVIRGNSPPLSNSISTPLPAAQYKHWGELDEKKQYLVIIAETTKEIRTNPRNIIALRMRAAAYASTGKFEESKSDRRTILELTSKPVSEYDFEARCFANAGLEKLNEAISDCSAAIRLNPTLHRAYGNRGSVYRVRAEYDLAIADFTKSIELNPKYSAGYFNRGISYSLKKDYDLGIADFTKSIQIDPGFEAAYFSRGYAYGEKKLYDLAIADYSKAIEIEPKRALTYNNRGHAYFLKKAYDLAIANYTKAIELSPTLVLAYGNRANSYEAKGMKKLAEADRKKAEELSKKSKP